MTNPVTTPLSPGAYLRLRRCATGLSIEQVAVRIAPRPRLWQPFAAQIVALEMDAPMLASDAASLARQLTQAFEFGLGVWETLVELRDDPESQLPVPRLCSGCGCSWTDPCHPRTGHECAWRPAEETGGDSICTACPLPTPPAEMAGARESLAA